MGRFDLFSDLHINAVTLSRRPKSSEAFVYRRWLLSRILESYLDASTTLSILEEELRVTLMAANRYANNYHAWNHRMWIMSHLPQAQDHFINEWVSSEEWISKHVSEHSGLQYREYLFKQIMQNVGHTYFCHKLRLSLENFFLPLKSSELYCVSLKDSTPLKQLHSLVIDILEQKDFCSSCPIKCGSNPHILHIGFLAYELLLVTELIRLYPGHEALWCHRRFVLFSLYSIVKEINTYEASKSDISDGVPHPKAQKLSVSDIEIECNFLWSVIVRHEESLLEECSLCTPEESYQSKLAFRHQEWVEKILKRSGSCVKQSTS
ncbi:protein prenyltransferase alpha subunit repeat-containing protein 1-B-like isoform X5 [Thrips palmi]|nr:protein prenyltransferase alpha subunit repeat-containing protein 1-B-like isoform X5 [Thrips palmi]